VTHTWSAHELLRAAPSFTQARVEPLFPARETNQPARAESFGSKLKCGSHRAQPELGRVQPQQANSREQTGTGRKTGNERARLPPAEREHKPSYRRSSLESGDPTNRTGSGSRESRTRCGGRRRSVRVRPATGIRAAACNDQHTKSIRSSAPLIRTPNKIDVGAAQRTSRRGSSAGDTEA
jgi:hypothetical protein